MTNLLPIEYQKKNNHVMWARFIIMAAGFITATALVAFLALLPSYFVAQAGIQEFPAPPKAPVEIATARAGILKAQSLATLLSPFVFSTTTPTKTVLGVVSLKPDGITIDHITYSTDATGKSGRMTLSGVAQSPGLISTYRAELSKDTRFKTVSVPFDVLIGTKDKRFTLTIEGNF